MGSRSEVSKLIQQGRVTFNGKVVKSSSERIPSRSTVYVDNAPCTLAPSLMVYYKPVGVHSTVGDPWGRENLLSLYEKYPLLKPLHPVGRLDCDTSGLLLFSSNGKLTNQLLDPSNAVPRVYEVIVSGCTNQSTLAEALISGVETSDGTFPARLEETFAISNAEKLRASNNSEEAVTGDFASQLSQLSYVRLSVTEGKYRMVRRILHNAGHSVLLLHRTSFGAAKLSSTHFSEKMAIWPPPSDLEEGLIRACTQAEESGIVNFVENSRV
eukprot:gene33663-40725_t